MCACVNKRQREREEEKEIVVSMAASGFHFLFALFIQCYSSHALLNTSVTVRLLDTIIFKG